MLLGFATLFLGSSASAEKPATVHHPDCPSGFTLIKDQPPHGGLSVTVAHDGNMFIKAGPFHFGVPAVSAGEVYGPGQVSGWPMNKPGNAYLEISHVDYCVPEAPPTTEPPVTEPPVTDPPTTEPPVTEPPTTEPPVTEPPCAPDRPGSWCYEPPVVQPPIDSPSPPSYENDLPQTGAGSWLVLILGLAFIGGGGFLIAASRRTA